MSEQSVRETAFHGKVRARAAVDHCAAIGDDSTRGHRNRRHTGQARAGSRQISENCCVAGGNPEQPLRRSRDATRFQRAFSFAEQDGRTHQDLACGASRAVDPALRRFDRGSLAGIEPG